MKINSLAALLIAVPISAAADPAWHAKWAGAHHTTVLDQTFQPTLDGRKALQEAIIDLSVYAGLAWQCHVRSLDWAANIDRHLDEVAEDPDVHLNDARPQADVTATLKNIIGHAPDSFDKRTPDEQRAMCLLVPGATELKQLDEIGRRKLLRHHDEWEGAGGD